MKVNFKKTALHFTGEPITEKKTVKTPEGKNEEVTVTRTLEHFVCSALFAAQGKNQGENADAAFSTYKLLQRIMKATEEEEVEITVEEAALIKSEVSKNYVFGISGQIIELLEG